MVAVWQDEEVNRCVDCGTFEWEWEEDAGAWEASPYWCLGCRSVQLLKREISDQASSDPEGRAGWRIRLEKGGRNGD